MKLLGKSSGNNFTAGLCFALAVILLYVNFIFISCNLNQELSSSKIVYIYNNELYCISPLLETSKVPVPQRNIKIKQRSIYNLDDGNILLWNAESKLLLKIDSTGKVLSSISINADSVYLNDKFILCQSVNYNDELGFPFILYEIQDIKKKTINIKKEWSGYIDCFISDVEFTNDEVFIAGGNKDDSKNNIYSISSNGIKRYFSNTKNNNFIRLIFEKNNSEIFAFESGRDKSKASSTIYKISNDRIEEIDLTKETFFQINEFINFKQNFQCFFGFGFSYNNEIVLPVVLNDEINFLKYDFANKKITGIIPNVVGCIYPLGKINDEFLYVAKDSLNPESFYGVCSYNGAACKKVIEF